jgi:hypothetical protein
VPHKFGGALVILIASVLVRASVEQEPHRAAEARDLLFIERHV